MGDTDTHIFPTYKRWDLTFDHAKGDTITTKEGHDYLDFMSGIGTVNMGHSHPDIVAAVEKQVQKGWHASNFFHYEEQERVASLLAEATGLDFVFYGNSGSEANEAAIKLARKATGKESVVSFTQSFHGRTYGSLAATGQSKIQEGFDPLPSGFTYAPYNEVDELAKYVDDQTAAIILEVIQGEGGVVPGERGFLKQTEALAKQHGALLIIDEVQTGMGRTGSPFSFQKYGLTPDIVTVAKGLGNGFPVSAMIGSTHLKAHFGPGSHGTTFGGNPLAMAAVEATLHVLNTPYFLEDIHEKSQQAFQLLNEELRGLDDVVDIRGDGLMIGIACKGPVAPILTNLQAKGLLALPAGEKVIRLLPPLTISQDRLMIGLKIVVEAIKESAKTTASR
ncbi:acetylornithine aminotransferase [Geomicrobium halophilum]|uniref:Acetylornithine aminotransferase n=1 Tax=Geomicrobium halophilum TaxID=549000 RepID=A0A841PMK3_9BACL|nr:acetylornithine aminotransferase [Geomicrobium halophilum]